MELNKKPGMPRREFLGTSLAGGVAAGSLLAGGELRSAEAVFERIDVYTDKMSYLPGQAVAFCVSTNVPALLDVEIARLGAEREVIWQTEKISAAPQAIPPDAALNGCKWSTTFEAPIANAWRSGIYQVILRGSGDSAAVTTETLFIVRSPRPGRDARILFQLATNTYQAYNIWGGTCLYSGPKFPRVSFDRPFVIRPTHRPADGGFYNPNNYVHHTWDVPFAAWAEQAGYAIDYCANLDLEFEPEMLKGYRLVLSVGHDEYWSAGMRDNLEAFIAAGGNAAFFSGNTVCWQVRVEDQGRALVCYKRAHDADPVFATEDLSSLSTLWSEPLVKRPENQMTGVGFAHGGYNAFFGEFEQGPGAGEYTTHRPNHWVFAGTGLEQGEVFGRLAPGGDQPGIAGYECDGCEFVLEDGLPVPTGRDGAPSDMLILATAPARWSEVDGTIEFTKELRAAFPEPAPGQKIPDDPLNVDGSAVLGIYQRGGTVVTVGSCGWSYGLAAKDPIVDRIVRNVLDRLGEKVEG